MREHRINCTTPEIRAYQSGERTLRRRVQPQPQPNKGKWLAPVRPYLTSLGKWTWVLAATGMGDGTTGFYSPFGSPGDTLVLREAWKPCNWAEGDPMTIQFKDGVKVDGWDATEEWTDRVYEQVCIELDAKGCEVDEHTGNYIVPEGLIAWRSARSMPRWAARYTPTVRAVTVEQIDGVWWWVCEVEG